ncbi:hypothetical protein QBC38DRAFT_367735 [Podospora fimiseda]|uniref:C2H2-type domain-containing protein n=1 Tax=Podospora fimiseda TaxID=252190 RepID=A0AAN7BM98_9PEZI|nr:hypothetical protein QBC38DRAFT_367735 [Podospora fimiseda]
MARHSKPFKCDFPDCPRAKEGFGTHNDLDRHKICVHKVHMPDRVRYRCHVDGCKDGKKKWPRQDNFKQHLRRMHGMEEIEDISSFIYKSETEPEDAQSNAMSESTPSETGMSSIDAHSSIDVHSSWAELSLGLSGPGSSSDRTAGAATGVQSADLIQFSSSDHMMDDQSDFNLGDTTGLPGQTRSSFISDGLEMELAGLMDVSYRQDDRSISQDNHMDHQTFSASSTLSHTGTGMAMFSFGGGSEIQTHSPNILIQGDDTQLDGPHGVAQEFAHEDDYSQQHYKTEPLTPMCEDEMPTDEPVSYHDAENDYESEDAEADGDHDLTLSKMDEIQPINSQNVQSEIDSSLRTLFTSAAAFSPPSEGDHHSPGSIDLDTTEASALAALRALRDNPASIEKILQRLGYPTKPDETDYLKEAKLEIPEVKTPAALSVAGEPTISKTIPCGKPGCDKVFWRQCELKKHHRRHDKPYACTFEKCDKRFGSKNDWKRHENSQHSQFEIWRCVEQVIISGTFNPTECGRVFHRRDSLQQHLERDHEIFDALQVERKLNEYRHGRNFESRFWCGFCVKTLEPQGGHVGPVHSERFDHIDRHFMGSHGYAKADISMWVGLDAEVVEIVDVGGVVDIVESRDKGKEVIVILDDDEVGDSSDKKRGSEEQEWGSRKSKKARKGVEGESPESGSASAERLWSCVSFSSFSTVIAKRKILAD